VFGDQAVFVLAFSYSYTVKKKRKCPFYGKYRVKLKSEITPPSVSVPPAPGAVVIVEETGED
jgi:hypothetical protein